MLRSFGLRALRYAFSCSLPFFAINIVFFCLLQQVLTVEELLDGKYISPPVELAGSLNRRVQVLIANMGKSLEDKFEIWETRTNILTTNRSGKELSHSQTYENDCCYCCGMSRLRLSHRAVRKPAQNSWILGFVQRYSRLHSLP